MGSLARLARFGTGTALAICLAFPALAQQAGSGCNTAGKVYSPTQMGHDDNKAYICDGATLQTLFTATYSPLALGIATSGSPVTTLDVNGEARVGTTGAACASGIAGAIRYSGGNLQYCDGTAWAQLSTGGETYPAFTAPVDGNFSWVNQGSTTDTATNSNVYLSQPAQSGDSFGIREQTAPATPYSIVAALIPQLYAAAYNQTGLVFRESSTGKLTALTIYAGQYGGYTMQVSHFSDPFTYVSNIFSANIAAGGNLIWLKISDSGTTETFSWSLDGTNFQTVASEADNAYFTSHANQVGFYIDSNNSTYPASVTLFSWQQR